jgi:hypothetical protein
MSVAATQHEIAVARVMAHMEIHISDLLCLATLQTRRETLSSKPDTGKMQKDAFRYRNTEHESVIDQVAAGPPA